MSRILVVEDSPTQAVQAQIILEGAGYAVFLAGDVWPLFLRDMASMLAVGAVFFGITRLKSKRRLD